MCPSFLNKEFYTLPKPIEENKEISVLVMKFKYIFLKESIIVKNFNLDL